MAFMKLGSKSEAFHREGQTWLCTTGLVSDVTIEVGDMKFHLHKFPLLSRSGLLERLIEESSTDDDGSGCVLTLDEIPGGGKTFELVTKFCYGVKIELTAFNVVALRCAAEYLDMTDNYGEGNLVGMTETFLNEVFNNWTDSIKALQTCEEVTDHAEDLNVISRCVDSLASKACADPNLFKNATTSREKKKNTKNEDETNLWNGISASGKITGEDWWFDDASFLVLPLFKRLITAIESRGMKLENIAMAVMYYARKHIPLMNRQATTDEEAIETPSRPSEDEQKTTLEEIVSLLPSKKGVNPTKFLLRLLQTAMVLHASQSSREDLETRIGNQLDQAALVDLLIPNVGYSETLYDVECVLRMIEQFVSSTEQAGVVVPSPSIEEDDLLTPTTLVATLVDGYLAEVAPDVNLKLAKFEAIAAAIPDYARPLDDGVYHAIDVYLKAHAWITDSEREQICRLMNCQKLSLEASTHAAQNERLPLRVIVQVLFFEQLRLRTSISGWLFVSENLDNPDLQQSGGNGGGLLKPRGENVREKVSELERECMDMKEELQKLVRSKRSWKNFTRKLNFKKKSECCNNPKDQAKQAT
ncbi:BTB/POZ domain-containing protein [Raphanus sativus]|uniref:BTB/POZ domain-containing protein At5g03250 n=1 Tax=Raphanus sativus TaxID=3726 RepID=A0A6J0K5P4_RAPSA|nr:BTB/POZ domain-containing protein At5g03250 [Raphanus sativus]KAJ4882339.1 BTB/POZ domain-containing protein [Raphanus sativus]